MTPSHTILQALSKLVSVTVSIHLLLHGVLYLQCFITVRNTFILDMCNISLNSMSFSQFSV